MSSNLLQRIIVDQKPIHFYEGDTVLLAMQRAGAHPTGGGCICNTGDCPACLATVDGVSYVRTCQTKATAGMVVACHHAHGYPPLPTNTHIETAVPMRHVHCDVVVIGMGESGTAAAAEAQRNGKQVVMLDATAGQEAIAIYIGPVVVARTHTGMMSVHPREEIVVATGAAEIQPVVEGNTLAGVLTPRALAQFVASNIDVGRAILISKNPNEPTPQKTERVTGELLRVEGTDNVQAAIVRDEHGRERRIECDTVAVSMGLSPRNGLIRMAHGLPNTSVRAVGECAQTGDIPPVPNAGVVCPCANVGVSDLQDVWNRGFREMELVKRSSLAGTGTCQGCVCLPHMRSFLQAQGGVLQAPFTARPVNKQLTMGEISAGAHHAATPRTALDEEHRRMGAYMSRVGGWWRPWHYGNVNEEYWAVREAVSLGDVSTLGKILISGPDALEVLERLYPTKVSMIKAGRSRYVLLLDERGYVLDDGLISKDTDTRYALTFTSGGATTAELWMRDWIESWNLDVRILNQTMSLGAINVTGPLSNTLLARAGLVQPPKFMEHSMVRVAGVNCRVYRLSFTGELSYELHHPAEDSAKLWRALFALGTDLGIKPHGIQALLKLRLEKGHIIVGQDSDFDSTPRRLNHEWAVKLDKPFFVGKQALLRTNKLPQDKQLVALEITDGGDAPIEGAVIWNGADYAGYVTSSSLSPALGKVVLLGWVRLVNGVLPNTVTINGRTAQRVSAPFYDVDGTRAKG